MQRLAPSVARLGRLELLHLRGNYIGEESAQVLLDAVAGLPLSQGVRIMHSDA